MATEQWTDDSRYDCEYVGHEWESMGGGLELCLVCGAERWAAEPVSEEE